MVNWQDELKRYFAKKFKEIMGEEIPLDHIHPIEINFDLKFDELSLRELASVYSFAIMKENFEQAKTISEEFIKRNHEIKIETDDKKKTGAICVYNMNKPKVPVLCIKMKVLPDGMMIDFEKENF